MYYRMSIQIISGRPYPQVLPFTLPVFCNFFSHPPEKNFFQRFFFFDFESSFSHPQPRQTTRAPPLFSPLLPPIPACRAPI
jgi:hypothetical protein